MFRKFLSLWLLLSARVATLSGDCSHQEPDDGVAQSDGCNQPKKIVSQLGLAFEERPNYADLYLFWNQTINSHWFYELRAYGVYNFIVNAPPTGTNAPVPHPIVSDEKNQWGWAGVAIAGYVFDITDAAKFMPFLRYENKAQMAFTYNDKYHNRVNSYTNNYFIGGKLSMKVNPVFGIYAQYYGGYSCTSFVGKGYFAETSPAVLPPPSSPISPTKHPHFQGLSGTFELGAPYRIDTSWIVTPYIQLVVSKNHVSYEYTVKPYSLSPLTSSNVVWAIKVAKEF